VPHAQLPCRRVDGTSVAHLVALLVPRRLLRQLVAAEQVLLDEPLGLYPNHGRRTFGLAARRWTLTGAVAFRPAALPMTLGG